MAGISEKSFRRIQFGALGLCALALILLVLSMAGRSGSSQTEAALAVQGPTIPPEDFFSAGEPDYVPQVLLEREPRSVWTPEDAGSYWTNPLDQGEEVWKGRMKAAVDELLESVP